MRQEVAVQRVVGEKPSLMNQVARRANDSGGSLGNERDVHARERQILKTGIVGQKDGGEHTRTRGLMARPVSTSGFSGTKMRDSGT